MSTIWFQILFSHISSYFRSISFEILSSLVFIIERKLTITIFVETLATSLL